MIQVVTTGIVLTRTNYGEADRILTFLTPDRGKVRVIAKGVRRAKSKLAGGIELLSVSDITYIPGRGELGTLISSRLLKHYGTIVQDINRTMQAYDFIKLINKTTEDLVGEEYFELLKAAFAGLNELSLLKDLVALWFDLHLLKITGHAPNLTKDTKNDNFEAAQNYLFSYDNMAFEPRDDGPHGANLIKLLRLAYATESSLFLANIQQAEILADQAAKLVRPILQNIFRI